MQAKLSGLKSVRGGVLAVGLLLGCDAIGFDLLDQFIPCEGSSGPAVWLTEMAPWGSLDGYVKGEVCGVTPSECYVVGYIYVPDYGWVVKPYAVSTRTAISADGAFTIDTTTGGVDQAATKVAVFLLPNDFEPPAHMGVSELGNDLYDTALAYLMTERAAEPATPAPSLPSDDDRDGVADEDDNCPNVPNADQSDRDGDGVGDVCDPTAGDSPPPSSLTDADGDGKPDDEDNCPDAANADQTDTDGDGHGDACDQDDDGDGVGDAEDNCPLLGNSDQRDGDDDGRGDACDPQAILTVTGGTGSGSYDTGSTVQISAEVGGGQAFNQWTGDVGLATDIYSASTTITLWADTTVTATFLSWPAVSCKIKGLAFGPFVKQGQNPDYGAQVTYDQVRELVLRIVPYTDKIHTYGCSLGVEHAPEVATQYGLQVAVGAWIGKDEAENQIQMDRAVAIANAGHATLVVVGSEVLLRRDVSADTLVSYLHSVQSRVAVPVATDDAYEELIANPEIIDACDLVFANFYPYWEGVSIEQAISNVHQRYHQLLAMMDGKELVVGETGWPSGGNTVGSAVASPENAARYFLEFVSWAEAENVDYYYFEAFDEPWKTINEGPQGAHWGLFSSAGDLKTGMQQVFDCERAEDNWSEPPCSPGDPVLRFTYVPPVGSTDRLKGQVCGVNTAEHRISVYIRVGTGWWTKPYRANPLTLINDDGSWICSIVTGGADSTANRIATFLVPAGYSPPSISGQSSLPAELYQAAVTYLEVDR